jgi:hypothetical protein
MLPGTETSAPSSPLRYTTWSTNLTNGEISWDFGETIGNMMEYGRFWKILEDFGRDE